MQRMAWWRGTALLAVCWAVHAAAQPAGFPVLPRGQETCWNATTFPVWPITGDANRDASIDARDLAIVAADQGRTGRLRLSGYFGAIGDGAALGNMWSDVNGDGVVNETDTIMVQTALNSRVTAEGLPLSADGAVDLTGTEYGLALVWPEGPLDIDTAVTAQRNVPNRPLRTVLLSGLGLYDAVTGQRTGEGDGTLSGKYLRTRVRMDNQITCTPATFPTDPRITAINQDYRIDLMAQPQPWSATALAWFIETTEYFGITELRRRMINEHLVARLGLTPAAEDSLLRRQSYPRGSTWTPFPVMTVQAGQASGGLICSSYTQAQVFFYPGLTGNQSLDATAGVGEYGSLISLWLNQSTPVLDPNPISDVREHIYDDAVNVWMSRAVQPGARESWGVTATTSSGFEASAAGCAACSPAQRASLVESWRVLARRFFSDENGRCIRRNTDGSIRNIEWSFPDFQSGSASTGDTDRLFYNAPFEDFNTVVGAGFERATLLYLKTISLMGGTAAITADQFAQRILQAAAMLWPSPLDSTHSIYHDDLVQVLSARGFLLQGGQTDPGALLPPAVGPSRNNVPFASSHPATQPGSSFAKDVVVVYNGYTDQMTAGAAGTAYVAYTFYKHSQLGASDYLDLRGTTAADPYVVCTPANLSGEDPLDPIQQGSLPTCPNPDARLHGREAGNLTVLIRGDAVNWTHIRGLTPKWTRIPAGYYQLDDLATIGYRCVSAIPNGFAFEVQRMATAVDPAGLNDRCGYRLRIVDPSHYLPAPLGANATYAWTFTDVFGVVVTASGDEVEYSARADEPFTVQVVRTRPPLTAGGPARIDTINLRERGSDLDRAGPQGVGRALVLDATGLIPPPCGSSDFNGDGDLGTDGDIEAFFACLSGSCCTACWSADFNGDGDLGTDADIESFFRVLAGGPC